MTYRNNRYGYELRYPSDAQPDTLSPATISFAFPRHVRVPEQPEHPIFVEYIFSVDVSPNPHRLSPASWFAHLDSLTGEPGSTRVDTVVAVSVGKRKGLSYLLNGGDEGWNNVYLSLDTLAFRIQYQEDVAGMELDLAPYKAVFDRMLRSIRFTNATE